MKRFTITGVRTIDEYVTYTVEAETEDEAIEMVENGEVDDNDDHWQRETSGGEDYTVTNVEELEEDEEE
jgi:hypothetical protein